MSERPNKYCIIAGFPRCGTTALFRYLSDHPQVCGSIVKETNFFVRHAHLVSGSLLEEYAKLFARCSRREVWLEASPSYVHFDAADNIASVLPHALLIFLVRDPVKRFESFCAKKREMFTSSIDLHKMIWSSIRGELALDTDAAQRVHRQLQLGQYYRTLQTYSQFFPTSQMLVVFQEDMAAKPYATMKMVCSFLGIEAEFYRGYTFTRENESLQVRYKNIYRLALNINQKMEPFLNKHPEIRRTIRDWHHKLNSKREQTSILSPAVKKQLHQYYEASNRVLRDWLLQSYPTLYQENTLPNWLKKA